MKRLRSIANTFKQFFSTPVSSSKHWGLIVFIGVVYVFLIPQLTPSDWDLNTSGLWADGLNMYQNPDRVYPPWALIMLLPYRLIRPEGARLFSVIVIGWLAQRRSWSLSKFLAIVLGPYFWVTLSRSGMDIFVLVLPLLLWESVENTRWQTLGRGLALSIYLLKPQGAILIWLYLLWMNRSEWRELVKPLLLVAALVIPISLVGSPPLIVQWLDNIIHPSPQNEYFWSNNNISLSTYLNPLTAFVLLAVSFIIVERLLRWRGKQWRSEHTLSGLLMVSMLLSPYTSQQSFSSALAFVPSWRAFFIQYALMLGLLIFFDYRGFLPLWIIIIGLTSLYFYQPEETANDETADFV